MNEPHIQEQITRQAIESVLLRYATALDERNWPDLANVFTADAIADYQGIGTFVGRESVTGIVSDFLGRCGPTQHMITNIRIVPSADHATSRCYLQAIHAGEGPHAGKTMTVWGEYSDRLERLPEGWRIKHRTLKVMHVVGDIGVALSAPD